jgi:hypothetical protein
MVRWRSVERPLRFVCVVDKLHIVFRLVVFLLRFCRFTCSHRGRILNDLQQTIKLGMICCKPSI